MLALIADDRHWNQQRVIEPEGALAVQVAQCRARDPALKNM
jgi:hypothetical protein